MFSFYEMMSPSFRSSKNAPATFASNGNNSITSTAAAANNNSSQKTNGVSGPLSETNQLQQRKCENLIAYFTTQIQRLNKELEMEKHSRDTHFAKIVKALLCFEAKLKGDQKQIRQQLHEKDTQLNRLAHELKALRAKYGVKDDEPPNVDATAQYCPSCRKEYYSLATRDVGLQCSKHEFMCHDGLDKENKTFPTSSSEDGLGHVFSSEARRSKRYMSKRTSGTFREYLKSRNIDLVINDTTGDDKAAAGNQPLANDAKPPSDNNAKETLIRKGSIRRPNRSPAPIKCDINGNKTADSTDRSSESQASGHDSAAAAANAAHESAPGVQQTAKSVAYLKKYDDEVGKPKTQFESTDDWYASASDMDDSDGAVSKPYGYNAVNPVLECVNQILLQQSMDGIMEMSASDKPQTTPSANTASGNDTAGSDSPPAKDPASNTLKKRVHFSTQNSMVQVPRSSGSTILYQLDTSTVSTADTCTVKDSTAMSYASIYSNEYEPIGSENNSTNHYVDMDSKLGDDRLDIAKMKTPPALPPKPPNLMKLRQMLKMPAFPIQSSATVKSLDNESEPDYCSIGDVQETMKNVQIIADVHKNADDDVSSHASEETFADVPRLPNVKAIISPKKEVAPAKCPAPEPSILKASSPPRAKPTILPAKAVVANVLSDINAAKSKIPLNLGPVPKPKIIADIDDTAIKAHLKLLNHTKMATIAENAKPNGPGNGPALPSSNPMKALPIIKESDQMPMMPIQAEFDWYNLDDEYGKLLAPSLLDSGKDSESDDPKQFGVEYNLDAEFSLTSCSLSSDNNSSLESSSSTIHFVPITVTDDSSSTTTVCNPIADEDVTISSTMNASAQLKKLISPASATHLAMMPTADCTVKSFDSFLEQTGLTTKPLPQKRKIFYDAPFV